MTENNTQTTVVAETTEKVKVENKALFLVFAEFLGYVSPLVEWAEEKCKTRSKTFEAYKQKAIDMDAVRVFKKMENELGIGVIRKWWKDYYNTLLKEYDETVKEDDGFPF